MRPGAHQVSDPLMSSAGTGRYCVGPCSGNNFKQSGPSETAPAPEPEKPSIRKLLAQAQPQMKPIWRLEKKHVGTTSAALSPGLFSVPPQPGYLFNPSTLCNPRNPAVTADHSSSSYQYSLPDSFSDTLRYHCSIYRHKPYQQLESFCLSSDMSEKRSFSLLQKNIPVSFTAGKAMCSTVNPMIKPLASLSTDPDLSLATVGGNTPGQSLTSAISGKVPPVLSSSSSSYKPLLNNNSFMRPIKTKVSLSPITEALKPMSSPTVHLASWQHSGANGDSTLQQVECQVTKSSGAVLADASTHTTLCAVSSVDVSTTSVTSPQYNQSDLAKGVEPHPCGLNDNSVSQTLTKEIQFTEAVRRLTIRDRQKMRKEHRYEKSCFVNSSLQLEPLERSRQWKPPVINRKFPQEDPRADRKVRHGASDASEVDSKILSTKHTTSHHLASHAGGLSHSPACGPAVNSPPRGGDKTPILPSPPQPLDMTDDITHLSSSTDPSQPGKERQKKGREIHSPTRHPSSAPDFALDQVGAKDLKELEDCCHQSENKMGKLEGPPCGSAPRKSVAVVSRKCTQVLTKPFSNDKALRPALTYSLFPNMPPTIYFGTKGERVEQLPWEHRKLLRWKMSAAIPNIVKQTIKRSHFRVNKGNDDWLGCWSHHMKSPCFRTIREHQKLNHFPGSFQIGRKDRLWQNLSHMQSRFGKKEFSFFPESFVLPQDSKLLHKAWEHSHHQKWIVKPPASARGIGIQVIHKWSQLPKRRPLLVQRYLHQPYLIRGSKFDLRIYVYVTSYDPLRVYLFSDGLVRFASCRYSPSMKSLSNKFMHLTNYSINKKNAEYQINEDETACQGHKWALKALWNYLKQKGINSDAIWEKIKDIVVKTIISSESYVNNLLKMYVRRSYSCHELFGFDILLDESLKPWVLEVNISPSLHSNSPLDITIKGQMIRDLLNLAGFVLPSTKDAIYHSNHSSSSCTSLLNTKDKCQMTSEHSAAQMKKKAYYLAPKIPDQNFYASVLDILTPEDVRILVEMEDEFSRRGQFERIFPSRSSCRYLRFFEQQRYFNILTTQWEQRYHSNKLRGIDLLRSWCCKGLHKAITSDSAALWSLPASLLNIPKGNAMPNAVSKSETSKLGKHCSSEEGMLLSEDRATSKSKKVLTDLSSFSRKISSLTDSNDISSKKPTGSTQKLPVI